MSFPEVGDKNEKSTPAPAPKKSARIFGQLPRKSMRAVAARRSRDRSRRRG
jgi:hypothetical protein